MLPSKAELIKNELIDFWYIKRDWKFKNFEISKNCNNLSFKCIISEVASKEQVKSGVIQPHIEWDKQQANLDW